LSRYPQIRVKKWTLSLLILSGISWMVYLFAYEYLLRGVFLYSCAEELGIIAAIIINVSIYSLVHLPKGAKETIGAIPMGILLCILTLHFGTIWAAFWIHCSLALSNEWFSIRYHPEMKIQIILK
jgi:membrane protease YdiL (CAAX protease family)